MIDKSKHLQMRLTGLIVTAFLFQITGLEAQDQSDTLKLYYEIDKNELTRAHLGRIDSLISQLKSTSSITITAFADYLSGDDYNIKLSEKRAGNVKNYLLLKGIKENQITKSEGRGELPNKGLTDEKGIAAHRRVEIVFTGKAPEKTKEEVKPELKKQPETKKANKTLDDIASLKKGETLALKNLNFLPGRHVLTQRSIPEMEKLLETMKLYPTLKIEIQGHICCQIIEDGYDYDTGENKLSVNRAKYVYDYLISKGIDKNRLSYKGFGRTKPLVDPELSEDDANKNRRVEIMIVEK